MHDDALLARTRRHFFQDCAVGLGTMALAGLWNEGRADLSKLPNPLAPKKPHFPAKAKAVIYLFMAGGPSQLELFDHKPKLNALNGKPVPSDMTDFQKLLKDIKPDAAVDAVVLRKGKKETIKGLKLPEAKEDPNNPFRNFPRFQQIFPQGFPQGAFPGGIQVGNMKILRNADG